VSLRPSPAIADWAGAVSVWTLEDDANVGTEDETTKDSITALCSAFEDFTVKAIPAVIDFQNVTARFDPEMTAANLTAVDIAHARKAENELLSDIFSLCTTVTAAKVLGAARDALATMDKLRGAFMSYHRLDDNTALRMLAPRWVRDMLRADLTRGELSAEALAVADAAIDGWFSRRMITPVWHLDGRASAGSSPTVAAQQYAALVSGNAVPGFPAQLEFALWVEGDFLFLDGGMLDLGVTRDNTSNSTNTYSVFKETFEGVAFRGVEAVRLVLSTEPTGLSAGRIDTSAIAD
jgi:hypothetical protein